MRTRQDPSTKPYYRCLSCAKFRTACSGIPTRDMTLQEWCELIRDVMDFFHIPNEYVAKAADVSIKTVETIRAIRKDQDILRSTARRIELVVFGPVTKHFCDLDYDGSAATDRINALLAENEHLKKENARYAKIIDKYIE